MKVRIISIACCSIVSAFILSFKTAEELSTIKVEGGTISGTANNGIHIFKGVPFAAPPVGELRWKQPQPVVAWKGIRRCDKFSASPMQAKPDPFLMYTREYLIPETPISEDCLYLNVWSGAVKPLEKRPVLVWIYGGGLTSGGSACPIYDGEKLAKKGIVFVSINYRVGVLGFMAHPDLSKESPQHVSGNYGFFDQLAALKWVKKNIAAFGGDPDNVTIAGQSAGSWSVNCLVASPLSKGYFNKAIAESGGFLENTGPGFGTATLQKGEQAGTALGAKLKATTITELRNIPAEELITKGGGPFTPVIDGYYLPQSVHDIFAAHKNQDVPLLTGWNADEGFLFTFKDKDEYTKSINTTYGNKAAEFLKYFPGNTDEEAKASQVQISRNTIFAMQNDKWAALQSIGKNPAYVYYFQRVPPNEFATYGAFHTAEVPYFLGTLNTLKRKLEPTDLTLSDKMSSYYANFCKTGNPNGTGLPQWPKFEPGKGIGMVMKGQPVAQKIPGIDGVNFMLSNLN